MLGPLAYIGPTEVWIIAGVVIVLFGGAKMAQFGRGLGEGIREFKKSMNHDEPEEGKTSEKADRPAPTATTTPVTAEDK